MKIVGIMTGNSLDAVDVVLTEFDNGKMKDIASLSEKYPKALTQDILNLREKIKNKEIKNLEDDKFMKDVVKEYTSLAAETVNKLLKNFDKKDIAAIGFHGQTLDHFPPSIAGGKKSYTLQVGDAKLLADLTGLAVAYDFRSDDVLNGGEGAPLAPVHNLHIAKDLKAKGVFPVAFCNAGNTGNIAVISENKNGEVKVVGWDVGPFNHFADYLVRKFKNEYCDEDGRYGKQGKVIPRVLEELFDNAAVNAKGENFYLQIPPKSSDPSWYRILDVMDCGKHSFFDVLRTVEYLSAYTFVYNLKYVPYDFRMPDNFLVFGGGWKNPVCMNDFKEILKGGGFVLDKHKDIFAGIYSRFEKAPEISWSDKYGYSGEFMEARIFADMAYALINNQPFTFPETTNCKSATVCGIWAYPGDKEKHHIISRAVL
ncbi:MAG: anhydro-N-acetylmuramic acid kinase [Lactobacillaceae bacterium]|jgi:anhydro-N-acetylmuramic acid kinase|nr:anhydro-N-acetylmuramic acid kinase [Lactobacillaceae bacterium]